MRYFSNIQNEFVKLALDWDELTPKQQMLYLKQHPKSKKKLTGKIRTKSKEQKAVELLSKIVKESPWAGKVFLAGGFVRDELLGRKSKDIDVTVADLDGGIQLANYVSEKLHIREPVIFPVFGTAKIQLKNGIEIEFVQTRNEEYVKGSRKPKTSYGTIKEDVERRDFTINSLLYDLTNNKVLDLTGEGLNDLRAGIIRTPLEPNITFTDDALRMLRAIRFAGKYKFEFAGNLLPAITANAKELNEISAERIQEELNKILVTDKPSESMNLLKDTGLLEQFAPELLKLVGLEQGKYHQYDVWNHTMHVLDNTAPTIINRLAGLLHDVGKPIKKTVTDDIHFYEHEKASGDITKELMKRLKYPNDMTEKVAKIVESHMRTRDCKDWSNPAVRRFIRDMGPELDDVLDLIVADRKSHHPDYNDIDDINNLKEKIKQTQLEKPVSTVKLPISGDKVMEILNISSGPKVGEVLKFLEDKMLENPNMTEDEAINLVKTNF